MRKPTLRSPPTASRIAGGGELLYLAPDLEFAIEVLVDEAVGARATGAVTRPA